MIVYFADRKFNITGQASTGLPKGLTIKDDLREQDVETGVASFECVIGFDDGSRSLVERCATPGNYILRSDGGENEFYTIIEAEIDTKNQEVSIYAEDAGLDLLNEIVGEYEADKAYPINHYIEKFAYDAGFEIGTNEVASLTRKLSWDGEQTVTERIASIATQFDSAEVSYSFKVKGLRVVKKYINIYKKRGKDIGAVLRLNRDIDRIITTQTITNLATALLCTGGTPEGGGNPINLSGYQYDDGDFFTDGRWLKSRKALEQWNRYTLGNGWIVKPFEYDTTDQKTLCTEAIAELKKAREMEVNYDVEISKLPDNARIGDRVNIVDDGGGVYVSARILKLRTSVVNQDHTATIGEYLIKDSGINQKVADLAAKFAQTAQSATRALSVATAASTAATEANGAANNALAEAGKAQQAATEATTAANNATQSAQEAQQKANDAQAAVDSVEESVEGLQTTVANAQAAAEQAQQAAQTAETKATEAHNSAVNAGAKADEAATAAGNAQTKADEATTKAETAKSAADQAKADAETAATTAAAAKLDAENAKKDIDSLGENLTTLSNTMSADYARKTDLTEAEASLQSQITQNAAQISSTVSRMETIDETANNAQAQAQAAQTAAGEAQTKADQASADAQAAQTAANNAASAASSAQSEADAAKAAAATAKSVADKAEEDLEAAKADLATVSSRVGATEADIAEAQQAVQTAQTAADKAKADAEAAAKKATDAQGTADTAVSNAATAQAKANEAAGAAALAQQTADAAKGDASKAQAKADEAAQTAATAQATANTAKTNAENAQAKADQAAADAATAQQAADDADAKAAQAATDLATAQQNLASVTSRVDATEAEVEAAQAAVVTAQAAADKAKADAATAQSTADTAKANAATAQTAANNAKTAADNAKAAADEAQAAADAAQDAVDALAIRVTKTETDIVQTSEQIKLLATKEEVTQTLGGYYTKAQTDAAISVKADEINLSVDSKIEGVEIGGRNLIRNSESLVDEAYSAQGITESGSIVTCQPGEGYPLEVTAEDGATITRTGKNLFGGNALVEALASTDTGGGVVVNETDKTIMFSPALLDRTGHLFDNFKENTQYTIILYGYNTAFSDGYVNLRLVYTDNTTEYFFFGSKDNPASANEPAYVYYKTQAGKTPWYIRISYISAGTVLFYDQCGIFEGDVSLEEFEAYKGESFQLGEPIPALPGINTLWADNGIITVTAQAITLEPYSVEGPNGEAGDCARFVVANATEPFTLSGVAVVGQEYTFSFWLKSDAPGSLSICGKTLESTETWVKHSLTFTAESKDLPLLFGSAGAYYLYHAKLESGNKATDWTPAPEDMASGDDLAEQLKPITESITEIQAKAGELTARVGSMETSNAKSIADMNDSITVLQKEVNAKMTPEAVEVEIKKAMENGTEKVVTNTGYRFDEDGLTIDKSDSEMKTQITDIGMTVYQSEEAVLEANSNGVDAKNLHATTYLIVGKNSRFEDYGNGRTGCFWIGG